MSNSLRVMVVDACEQHRASLVKYITSLGHEAMGLESAGDLLQLYERHQPHLVICEYDMDEMPAWKLAHQLLGMSFCPMDSKAAKPYMVALSREFNKTQRALCQENGVDVYDTKPITAGRVMRWARDAGIRSREG